MAELSIGSDAFVTLQLGSFLKLEADYSEREKGILDGPQTDEAILDGSPSED